MTFRIAHISDTHLGREKPYFTANFLKVARHIAASRFDLVLNSGDMSLDGAGCEDDLREARRLHETLHVPLRLIPGNHDLGESQDAPRDGGLPTITAARRQRYLACFGDDYWSLELPGWRILAINAQLLGSDLAEADAQLRFVRQAAVSRCKQLALFVHKPLFDASVDEGAVTGRFVNPAPRRQLLDTLADCTPALIASGHVHQYRATQPTQSHHVWAPSTGFVLPDDRQPRYGLKQTGYVEHALHSDGTHASTFVAVPGLDTLSITDFPEAYRQYGVH